MNKAALVRIVVGFVVVWTALAVVAWLHIRALPVPAERKKWFDRYVWILAAFVAGTGGALLIQRGAVAGALATLPVVAGVAWFRIRQSHFCLACGKYFSTGFGKASGGPCPHCAAGAR